MEQVKATLKSGTEVTVNYDFGANLDEMVKKFGPDATFSNAKSQMKIRLQALMRERGEKGVSLENLANWKPGVSIDRVIDPIALVKAQFKDMDPAARKKFLEDLAKAAAA